jgi:general secretion pathway protein A
VPRLINIVADRALAGAYASEAQVIGARLVHAAADEVQPGEREVHGSRLPWLIAAAAALALAVITIAMMGRLPSGITAPWNPDPDPDNAITAAENPEETRESAKPASGGPSEGVGAPDSSVQSPAVSPVPLTQVDATLDEDWLGRQNAMAWHGLAELWNKESQSDAIRLSCAGAQGTGFACLHGEGNWSRIQRLGLPALLVLHSDQPRYLLLRGVGESQVLVGVGDAARWIPRSLIEDHWLGRYVLPWPQAPEWPSQIRRGERGEAVDIVMELAGRAEFPWMGDGEFDEGFESWLIGFQRRHGLVADGIVGPETLLHLMAPTISTPRLATRHELTAQDS